jgi:hypothetical protein
MICYEHIFIASQMLTFPFKFAFFKNLQMKAPVFLISIILIGLFFFNKDLDNRGAMTHYAAQDSELALLMREIHENAKLLKLLLQNGEDVKPYGSDVDFILEAEPTRPAVQGPEFESFARYYIKMNEEVYSDPNVENYNSLVESCVACHQEFCPGPIKTIKKLHIKGAVSPN